MIDSALADRVRETRSVESKPNDYGATAYPPTLGQRFGLTAPFPFPLGGAPGTGRTRTWPPDSAPGPFKLGCVNCPRCGGSLGYDGHANYFCQGRVVSQIPPGLGGNMTGAPAPIFGGGCGYSFTDRSELDRALRAERAKSEAADRRLDTISRVADPFERLVVALEAFSSRTFGDCLQLSEPARLAAACPEFFHRSPGLNLKIYGEGVATWKARDVADWFLDRARSKGLEPPDTHQPWAKKKTLFGGTKTVYDRPERVWDLESGSTRKFYPVYLYPDGRFKLGPDPEDNEKHSFNVLAVMKLGRIIGVI